MARLVQWETFTVTIRYGYGRDFECFYRDYETATVTIRRSRFPTHTKTTLFAPAFLAAYEMNMKNILVTHTSFRLCNRQPPTSKSPYLILSFKLF